MESSSIIETVRQKFELLRPVMTERMCRHWAASEALALPRGGITMVAAARGLSRTTITAGMRALRSGAAPEGEVDGSRSRQPGGGRPLVEDVDATVCADLERLVEPTTRGDPMSPLRWTCKSTPQLDEALNRQGHTVSHQTWSRLLHALRYSLQAHLKRPQAAAD